ncbi:DNA-processing protein DprA [Listeria sp. PSOL-1]|uniref:DNA-processing protein DprA n=1 Tax=Listeria sp. PSOL-1 TaxID=1844999 RepID=UPI0013D163E8|nr:DNA-processing protein DprA [Listeria sp. PSOL-1]
MNLKEKETWLHLLHLSSRRRASIWNFAFKKQQFIFSEKEFRKLFLKPEEALYTKRFKREEICVFIGEADYPPLLREIYLAPPLLFFKGDIKLAHRRAMSVVGARDMSDYGRLATNYFVRELVSANYTIVSGLAIGIDAQAHQAALFNEGKTIAVLGSGLENIYPACNQNLSQKISEVGLLLSEYLPNQKARRWHFPDRNRIISGLALGTLVIEACERSGSLITAMNALEQNREVFAVPGNIFSPFSDGTHELIQQGAKLIFRKEHIMEELNYFCR